MSFRSRLRVFFTIIVIVPMLAVALVLFSITSDSETGKADARIAEGLRAAFALYEDATEAARAPLRRVARDPELQSALMRGRTKTVARRIAELERASGAVDSIAFYEEGGVEIARAERAPTLAPATAVPETASGRQVGTLAVSVTTAPEFVAEVARFTGLEVRVFRGGTRIGTSLEQDDSEPPGSGTIAIAGREYRGRFQELRAPVGPPVQIGLFHDADELDSQVARSRVLIGGILLAFLVLALVSSVFVVRALQGQVDQFLEAARRLGRGDFSQAVPTEGGDEFAALGNEFNSMSAQLAAKIDEVESKRRQVEEAIRRVGEAFAAGLDRQEAVDLAVRTAVEACGAHGGRAKALDARKMPESVVGRADERIVAALEAAERRAFAVNPEIGAELLATLDLTSKLPAEARRLEQAHVDGVHSLALPLRAHLGSGTDVQYVGVVSIARDGAPFSGEERDLFSYLAGQAVVSIENADLHETVQRQAVTDELTGLYNIRHFHDWIDDEIERSRRFGTGVGLVLLDLDDFKGVNDTHGHQQGDRVLVEVARVVRDLSRDIDEPARYGGEELAIVLPQTDLEGAEQAAERMRTAIEQLEIPCLGRDDPLRVTASFGVAALPSSADDKDGLIAAADAALYCAKRAGKNRVERAEATAATS